MLKRPQGWSPTQEEDREACVGLEGMGPMRKCSSSWGAGYDVQQPARR